MRRGTAPASLGTLTHLTAAAICSEFFYYIDRRRLCHLTNNGDCPQYASRALPHISIPR